MHPAIELLAQVWAGLSVGVMMISVVSLIVKPKFLPMWVLFVLSFVSAFTSFATLATYGR